MPILAGGQPFSCDSSMRSFCFRFFGRPTLPAFGRVGVLTFFPKKSNPPPRRKPRGVAHSRLQFRLKSSAPSPIEQVASLASTKKSMHNPASVSARQHAKVFEHSGLIKRPGTCVMKDCGKIPSHLSIDSAHLLSCGLFFTPGENIAKFPKNPGNVAIVDVRVGAVQVAQRL